MEQKQKSLRFIVMNLFSNNLASCPENWQDYIHVRLSKFPLFFHLWVFYQGICGRHHRSSRRH